MNGIPIHEGTKLTLVLARLKAGWAPVEVLEDIERESEIIHDIARSLVGEKTIFPDSWEQADKLKKWWGLK